MNSTISALYFKWLVGLVSEGGEPGPRYTKLLSALYLKEFTWFVPNDDNRIGDALEIRNMWRSSGIDFMSKGIDLPCSVLEVLMGLAFRMEGVLYEPSEGDRTKKWFWMMIRNLALYNYDNQVFSIEPERAAKAVDHILTTFLTRKYEPNGVGGLFPLARTKVDQRKVEIWYQMQAFLAQMFAS
jgi:hypothetical protein